MPFQNEFYKSAFSVDNVIFGFEGENLKVLLIKRKQEPYRGEWALPGDIVQPEWNLDEGARNVLKQLTGIENVYLEQVHSFGDVNRHPRGRVITIAYYSLIKISDVDIKPASFAEKVEWKDINSIENLAFDHYEIVQTCLKRLRLNIKLRPLGFELLPEKFTLTELQKLYESILEQELDKRNFRKKILSMNILKYHNELQTGVAHRPAKLYSFDDEKYKEAKENGFIFEI